LEDNVRKSMEESLKKHYGVTIETKSQNRDITEAWDNIQQSVCMRVWNINIISLIKVISQSQVHLSN